MALSAYPTTPTWPDRGQPQATFDANVSSTFTFFGEQKVWADDFAAEVPALQAALVAANLPPLSGQAGKIPFVNQAGTAVELDTPSFIETVAATNLGKVGDFDTTSWGNAVTDTITIDSGKIFTILMLGFYRFRANSTTELAYGTQIEFNGSVQSLSQTTGTLDASVNNTEQFTTWSLVRSSGSGSVTVNMQARCDTNVELDRAHLGLLAMRTS